MAISPIFCWLPINCCAAILASSIFIAAKSNLSEVNEKDDNYLMMELKARQTRMMSFCHPCTRFLPERP